MRYIQSLQFALSLGLVSLLILSPAFATAVLEGDENNGLSSNSSIQLIEGGRIVRPPIPAVPARQTTPSIASSDGINLMAYDATRYHPGNIASMVTAYNRQLLPHQVSKISEAINGVSNNYRLDPKLLMSLVAVESSFRPDAISSSGAIGLGQLKPDTAKWLGVNDPYDPADNLMGVAKYLRYLLDRYNGSVSHALAAYYQGQGTIDRQGINENALYYIGKVSKVFNRL